MSILLGFAYTVAFSILCYGFWLGLDYYTTPYAERPHHPDYRTFRPGGTAGLVFGTLGTLLMLGLLLYVVRKRTGLFGNLFRLSGWLKVHIFMGITGPFFILLHTSFKLNGLVAISFWAMVAVALSGVLGRYLYVQIPRNIRGDQLTLAEIAEEDGALTQAMARDSGLDTVTLQAVLTELQSVFNRRGLWKWVFRTKPQQAWIQAIARLDVTPDRPPANLEKFMNLARTKIKLAKRLARLDRVHRLFHYWHIIHRPFAAVMYLFMILHIAVAILFGISWKDS